MRRMMMLVAGLVMLTGCVSTKIVPLQQARMASLQGKTLTVLKREKPSFAAMTAGKGLRRRQHVRPPRLEGGAGVDQDREAAGIAAQLTAARCSAPRSAARSARAPGSISASRGRLWVFSMSLPA
jgi:hypothetical protein